jgi:hypothetical protein
VVCVLRPCRSAEAARPPSALRPYLTAQPPHTHLRHSPANLLPQYTNAIALHQRRQCRDRPSATAAADVR